MEDPLSVAPTNVLSQADEPIADYLSLRVLPLHIHEILIMAAFCEFCYSVASPMISARLFKTRYTRFSKDERLSWNKNAVYWVKNLIIDVMSLWVIMAAGRDIRVQDVRERVYGYDRGSAMIQALYTGYFLWEFSLIATEMSNFKTVVRIRATLAFLKSLFRFRPFIIYYSTSSALYSFIWRIIALSLSRWLNDKTDPLAKPRVDGSLLLGLVKTMPSRISGLLFLFAVHSTPFKDVLAVIFAYIDEVQPDAPGLAVHGRCEMAIRFGIDISMLSEILCVSADWAVFVLNIYTFNMTEQAKGDQRIIRAVTKGHENIMKSIAINGRRLDAEFPSTFKDKDGVVAYASTKGMDFDIPTQLQCSHDKIFNRLSNKDVNSQSLLAAIEEYIRMIERLATDGKIRHKSMQDMVELYHKVIKIVIAGQHFDTNFHNRNPGPITMVNVHGGPMYRRKRGMARYNSWRDENEVIIATCANHVFLLSQALTSSLPGSLPDLVDIIFLTMGITFGQQRLERGFSRVWTQCPCGMFRYEDFREQGSEPNDDEESQSPYLNIGTGAWIKNAVRNAYTGSSKLMHRLSEALRNAWGKCTSRPTANQAVNPQNDPSLYLLLCIDKGEGMGHFSQLEVQRGWTNKRLFPCIKREYTKHIRKPASWFTLRSIANLAMTEFLVGPNGLVPERRFENDTCEAVCICLPPSSRVHTRDDYVCSPRPTAAQGGNADGDYSHPVISPGTLRYWFHHARCLDKDESAIFEQLPKKKTELQLPKSGQEKVWGIYLKESWHVRTVCFIFMFCLFGSFVFGIVWAVVKGSIGDAFTAAAFGATLGSSMIALLAWKEMDW